MTLDENAFALVLGGQTRMLFSDHFAYGLRDFLNQSLPPMPRAL